MNRDCEIVRDLLPNYIEKLVSNGTKEYITNHISECSECKTIFEEMGENAFIETAQSLEAEEAEIRLIKKHKRKMQIWKFIIIALLSMITLAIVSIGSMYIPKFLIMKNAYTKIQEISNGNNYKFTVKQFQTDYTSQEYFEHTNIYYYKDGKYKLESFSKNKEDYSIYYGDKNSDTKICLDENKKTKEYQHNEYKNIFNVFGSIDYYVKNSSALLGTIIRDDVYNGKECYVFRFGNNDTISYREIWIDKETMMQVREIQEIYNHSHIERTFSIEFNIITEKDVTLSNANEYIMENPD